MAMTYKKRIVKNGKNQIDRGGLWHINNNVYLVFTIIEQIIRNYLHVESIGELGGNTRSTIIIGFHSDK